MKIKKFLIFTIMLIMLTVNAVNATENVTQTDLDVDEDNKLPESITMSSDVQDDTEDSSETLNSNSTSQDHMDASYDNKYFLFRGDCWTLNNNFESSAAITSETLADFTVTGTFRTQNDFVGIYWNSQDLIEHPYISYGNRSDYTGVILEFDYEMDGCMDFSNSSVNIIIADNSGETYFLTMNRFIENNHVILDFNNLTLLPGNSYLDKNGQSVMVKNETKLDVSDLKYVMLEILPENFVENNVYHTITANKDFSCKISNINVLNGEIYNEHVPLQAHQYRLCEGYDDMYNLNPFRISKEMRKLGYVGWVDLYIGASYFYEKSGVIGDVIADLELNHNRTEKMVLDKNVPLNKAFKAWLDCYARELKNNDVENLVISVSMENLQSPQSWRQMDSNGNYAMSGWVPATFLYTPCNEEVIQYMQEVSEACLDIVAGNGFKPILQMGETWWWWNENNWSSPSPCFYDNFTKAKYLKEHGSDLPVYSNAWSSEYDKDAINWLNQQLVQYSDALRQVVKGDKYDGGLYLALLFTPSVIDSDRVPPMMRDVNYLEDAYSPDKLDILQIEDYDWVIFESPHHNESYAVGRELGFSEDRLHYFGGFVQYPEDADQYWKLIQEAMDDAVENNFKEVFVWAGLQVRRDNKIIGHDEDALIENLTFTTVTAPDYVSVDEKFTIKIRTQNWVNGTFNIYDYNNAKKGELLASTNITDGYSSCILSSNITGLNSFYLELDYAGGKYHLIEDVYVVENSKNVTVTIPDEIETGCDVDVELKAPQSQTASAHISVDDNEQNSYEITNGEFSKLISGLSAGYHNISVKYDEAKLDGEIYSNTFTVNVGDKTKIEVIDAVGEYNSAKLTVTLKDSKDNLLKQKEISISLEESNYTLTTDDNGQATLKIDLLPGNYSSQIQFMGDNGYLSSVAVAEITVNKITPKITAPAISTTYNVAKNLVITLKDAAGNAMVGQTITVKLNNKNYVRTTDVNGQVKLSVSLPAKKYVANIVFAGSDVSKSSSRTVNVVVNKAAVKLGVSAKSFKVKVKTKKVTLTLKNNKNKAIKKATVYLKVNKKTYKVKTNSKGVATFKVKLTKKGKFTAVYSFKGNSNFKSASKKFKISIK